MSWSPIKHLNLWWHNIPARFLQDCVLHFPFGYKFGILLAYHALFLTQLFFFLDWKQSYSTLTAECSIFSILFLLAWLFSSGLLNCSCTIVMAYPSRFKAYAWPHGLMTNYNLHKWNILKLNMKNQEQKHINIDKRQHHTHKQKKNKSGTKDRKVEVNHTIRI